MTRRLFIFSFACVIALSLLIAILHWSNAAATPITATTLPTCLPEPLHGNTYFTPPGQTLSATLDDTRAVAWADVDHDNDPDLIVGNYGQPNILYFNDGTGHFPTSTVIGTGTDKTASVAWGFLNNDNHPDLVFGNDGQPNVIYFNDGNGNFPSSSTIGTGTDTTYSIAIGDANNDTFLDIAIGNMNTQNVVYFNNGTGQFPTSTSFGTGSDPTRSIALGFMNNDTALDLVVGNYTQQNRVYFNNGSGSFPTWSNFGPGNDDTLDLDIGDVNGDGYVDIVTANAPYAEPVYVHINDGTGQFSNISQMTSNLNRSVSLGDADGDGDLDIALGNANQYPTRVLLNNGTIPFMADYRHFNESFSAETKAVAWADADGDGDLDLAVGNAGAPDQIIFNQQKTTPNLYTTSELLFEDTGSGTPAEIRPAYTTGGILHHLVILEESDRYVMWVNNRGGSSSSAFVNKEQRLESTDGLVWTNRVDTNQINSSPGYDYYFGFSTIISNGVNYEGWHESYYNTVNGMWVQYARYLTSPDGLIWTVVNSPILSSVRDVNVITQGGLYHLWAAPDYDISNVGSQSSRYRTSAAGGTGWGNWQTGGSQVLVNGDETSDRKVIRLLPGDVYEMFYLYGSVINRAISTDGLNFTIDEVAVVDLHQALSNYSDVLDFEVLTVLEENWFYFSYVDQAGVSHLAVARPQPLIPISGLIAANDSPTVLGNSTTLSATITTGDHVAFTWAFGDGHYGCGARPAHVYPAIDSYTAIVTASNSFSSLAMTTTVNIVDVAVSGLAAANDSPTLLGNTTNLFATVSGGTNIQYSWAFGDGSYGNGANPTHTYPAVGNYTAIVTATNTNNSLSASTSVQVIDVAVSGLAAANDSPTILGNTTNLFATVSGGTNIQYSWAFGDGTYGNGASLSHVYLAVGNYTAVVTATNSNNSQSASTLVTIEAGISYTYLPMVSFCEATPIWADIALVIDTSGSMADPTEPGGVTKLAAAQTAAATFLTFLDLANQRDQAALVAFDNIATLEHPLSRDEATLLTAINNLQLGNLTRMDLGLQIARLELTGIRHDPDNQTAIIFLTDGQPNGTTEAEVLAQALLAKNAGITIFTIGLGSDVNSSLLQAVASTPAYYYPSPSTGDLSAIYQQIASSLACR